MEKVFITLFTFLLTIDFLFAQQSDHGIIYFEPDKFELSENSKTRLDSLIKKIRSKEITQIQISGHTDSDGAEDYNEILSEKRATVVFDYLLENGIEANKLRISNYGERNPAASNGTQWEKQKNRRVELLIEYDFSIPKGFMVGFSEFKINPNSDTIIVLDTKGSVLHVPKNCFTDKLGRTIKDTVTIAYREFRNSSEIAFSGIPMTYKYDNQEYCFNSSGMFEINGSVNGTPIEIAEHKTMKIDYALAKKNPEISFFKLNEDSWKKIQDIEPIKNLQEAKDIDTKVKFKFFKGKRLANCRLVEEDTVFFENTDRKSSTLLAEGNDPGHTYPDIVKGLNIESFGVYNCDQIYRLPNRVIITAKYIDEQGNEIKNLHVLSMIDLKYNGAFSFDPKSFICDAKGRNVLVLFSKKGELYVLDENEFAKMNIQKSGHYTFKMKNVTNEIKSTGDLTNYLGLKL